MKNTKFIELTDTEHPYIKEALKLYETSFPIEERESIQTILSGIRNNFKPEHIGHFFVLIKENKVAGFSMYGYYAYTRIAFLSYLAVQPELRGNGFGSELFRRTLLELKQDAKNLNTSPPIGMCWEVERPSDAYNEYEKNIRKKRIDFYKKNKSVLLDDIKYIAPPMGINLPEVPYYLMFVSTKQKQASITNNVKKAILDTALIYGYGLDLHSRYYKQALQSLQD